MIFKKIMLWVANILIAILGFTLFTTLMTLSCTICNILGFLGLGAMLAFIVMHGLTKINKKIK